MLVCFHHYTFFTFVYQLNSPRNAERVARDRRCGNLKLTLSDGEYVIGSCQESLEKNLNCVIIQAIIERLFSSKKFSRLLTHVFRKVIQL